jgi:lipoic acid synthetase
MLMRKPQWLKVPISDAKAMEVHQLLKELDLNTVCNQAHCPNIGECFSRGTATVLILGDICTRHCRFCAIESGIPAPPDPQEPLRVAQMIQKLGLKHCVITGVNRDDLPFGGAEYYADTIIQVRKFSPGITVEVLPGDFAGDANALKIVLEAGPDIFNHNLETVERLTPLIRDRRANYRISLNLLKMAKETHPYIYTKSGILVGLGETKEEILKAMEDLRALYCDGITIGQYLPPSRKHHPLHRFYTPEEFAELATEARRLGFKGVASGPLVRSSYKASTMFEHENKRGS